MNMINCTPAPVCPGSTKSDPIIKGSYCAELRIAKLVILLALPVVLGQPARAAIGDMTSVSSRISADYVREKLPDGSYKTETYAFGEGGYRPGFNKDEGIEKFGFLNVARTIAKPLSEQNYSPTKDPNQAKLLIMVYWGTTAGTADDPNSYIMYGATNQRVQLTTPLTDRNDYNNARLLGYDSEGIIGTDYGRGLLMTAFRSRITDITEEIRDNRYFVVLMAYDFQLLWKEKKRKLLWETRFSLREHRNAFDQSLPLMAQFASRYFGKDSHGLVRRPLRESINFGKLNILGMDESQEKNDFPASAVAKPKDPELIRNLEQPDSALPPEGAIWNDQKRPAELPLAIRQHITAYQQEKSALQNMLADRLKKTGPETETRATIDAFNTENGSRITALHRAGEEIRTELAGLAGTNPTVSSAGDHPLDALRREFSTDIRELQTPPDSVH
jgi:hypothetical protein